MKAHSYKQSQPVKTIFILLFFSVLTHADEFDWHNASTQVVELALEAETIPVTVGSLCASETGLCDIAAKFSGDDSTPTEFLREIANNKATITWAENQLVISLIYYPIGWDKGLKVDKYYEWNSSTKALILTHSSKHELEL